MISSSIAFLKDSLLLFQDSFIANVNFHETITIIIGYDNPFKIKTPGGDWELHNISVIAPDQPYECVTGEGLDAILFIFPECQKALKINNSILKDGKKIHHIDDITAVGMFNELKTYHQKSKDYSGISGLLDDIVSYLSNDDRDSDPLNDRVNQSILYIHSKRDHDLSIAEVATKVKTSEGMLNFMFRSQTGVSLSKFILWTSIASVIIDTINGKELIVCIKKAGFNNLSDFSVTFSKIFGITPKTFLENNQYNNALIHYYD